MNVSDVMSEACEIDAQETVYRAARLMRDRGVGALVVVERERLVGIVTDRDLVMRAVARGEPPWELPIRRAMTPAPATCRPGDPLTVAAALMLDRQLRRLVVVDDGGLVVGLLALEDLARHTDAHATALRLLACPSSAHGDPDGMYPDTRF